MCAVCFLHVDWWLAVCLRVVFVCASGSIVCDKKSNWISISPNLVLDSSSNIRPMYDWIIRTTACSYRLQQYGPYWRTHRGMLKHNFTDVRRQKWTLSERLQKTFQRKKSVTFCFSCFAHEKAIHQNSLCIRVPINVMQQSLRGILVNQEPGVLVNQSMHISSKRNKDLITYAEFLYMIYLYLTVLQLFLCCAF